MLFQCMYSVHVNEIILKKMIYMKPGEPLSPLEGHFGTVTALAYNSGRLQLFRLEKN